MPRKPVIPAALAESLTTPKPPAASARAVSVLASDELTEKTIDELTAEILALQIQGNKVLFAIGKRLIAAKEKLSHGDWLPWLESVNIPERLAQRYMQLAREWAANPSILSDLGMSKALALLALPEDTRAEFVAEGHVVNGEAKSVADMSAKELADAIKARKDAETELASVRQRLDESERRRNEAEQDAEKQHGELVRTHQRLELAQKETVDVRQQLKSEQAARFAVADELAALKAKPVDVAVEKVVDPAAIEAAKQEVRDFMQSQIDAANVHRTEAEKALESERRRADDVQHDLDVAKSDAESARKDAQSARKELERVKAEKTPIGNKDLSLFAVLFEQTSAVVNQMHGILLKQDSAGQEKMRKSLAALAESIRKKAES